MRLLIFYLLCFHAVSADLDNLLASDFSTLIAAADKIFEYFSSNVKLVDVNVMFGVFLAKVNLLSAMGEGVQIPPSQEQDIKRLIHYCNVLLYYFQVTDNRDKENSPLRASSLYNLNNAVEWAETLKVYAYTANRLAEELSSSPPIKFSYERYFTETTPHIKPSGMDSHVQKINRPRERKSLLKLKHMQDDVFLKWKNYKTAVLSYSKHSPNPSSSDKCLRSLVMSPYPPETFSACPITPKCREMIVNGTNYGYSLTHRAIMVMTGLFSRYCYIVSPESDTQLMDSLCTSAYNKETSRIFSYIQYEKPPFLLRDLFMEQISLCALIGHVHFLQRPWLQAIMSWQNSNGCFGVDATLDSNNMPKCETHMTSVALGALTAGIRFIAEFYYEDNVNLNKTQGLMPPPLIDNEELTMIKFG